MPSSPSAVRLSKRMTSRLAAVQALYQWDMNPQEGTSLIDHFMAHHFTPDTPWFRKIDLTLFQSIVLGVTRDTSLLDNHIRTILLNGWTVERLETVLRAILRAATFELLGETHVPPPVVINEYVHLSKAFFDGQEPGFINASLDRLVKRLCPPLSAAGEDGIQECEDDPVS